MGLEPKSIIYFKLTPVCFMLPNLCTSSIILFDSHSHAFLAAMAVPPQHSFQFSQIFSLDGESYRDGEEEQSKPN
uniref:Uncharacterized protein n=2 Tax=Rhizophora mucronata TaxID=61149 RepID=A0A2P2LR42_RHIMU